MRIIYLTSLDSPELQPYRTLRRSVEHQKRDLFVAEGEKVVRRLLESNLQTISILLTPEWLEAYRSLLETKVGELCVFVADKKLLDSIVGFRLHQGVMAVGRVPTPHALQDVLASAPHPSLFVAVDGLTNAENLGIIVRNCAALGADALLVSETSSSPYLRRAVRNSMGTVFRLPIIHLTSLVQALENLRAEHGIRCIAAHPLTTATKLHQARFTSDCCLVFGSEGAGISPGVLAACDESVAITMNDSVDSLNVACASAVFLYEVQRQRADKNRT